MDVLFLAVVIWAFADCIRYANRKMGDSRRGRIAEREKQLAPKQMTPLQRRATAARHDTGWWLREFAQGFPVTLYGWHAGWVAHQAAAEQQRAIRDEHRGIRDSYRAARAQGRVSMQAITRPAEGESLPASRAEMKDRLKTASPPAQARGQEEEAARVAHPASQPAPPEPAAGTGTPAAAVPPVQEPTEGVTVPAPTATPETTYTQDLAKCNKIIAECDIEATRLRLQKAAAWVEEMVTAGLSARHTGMAADLADRIEAQIKANQETHDYATALRDSIQRDHQAGHEYHSSAPDGGASREYLRD